MYCHLAYSIQDNALDLQIIRIYNLSNSICSRIDTSRSDPVFSYYPFCQVSKPIRLIEVNIVCFGIVHMSLIPVFHTRAWQYSCHNSRSCQLSTLASNFSNKQHYRCIYFMPKSGTQQFEVSVAYSEKYKFKWWNKDYTWPYTNTCSNSLGLNEHLYFSVE